MGKYLELAGPFMRGLEHKGYKSAFTIIGELCYEIAHNFQSSSSSQTVI